MRSEVVVDISPLVDDLACVIEREKDVLVQALLAELAVEGLHEGVLLRFARLDEVDLDLFVSPRLECP